MTMQLPQSNKSIYNSSNFCVEVINKKTDKTKSIYIGRGSPLGNPFSFRKSKYDTFEALDREDSIKKYENWIKDKLKYDNVESKFFLQLVLVLIREKKIVLSCFCKPLICHGDILAKLILKEAEKFEERRKQNFESLFS